MVILRVPRFLQQQLLYEALRKIECIMTLEALYVE